MTRPPVAWSIAVASMWLFACQPLPIGPSAIEPAPAERMAPRSSETPVPPEGTALEFELLGTAAGRLPDGELWGRIRSEEAWQKALKEAKGVDREVDFERHEVLALKDPLHGCLSWTGRPEPNPVRYERGFWLVELEGRVRYSLHVTPISGRYELLCRPADRMVFYRIPRLSKPIEDARGHEIAPWPPSPSPSPSPTPAGAVVESALVGAYPFKASAWNDLPSTFRVRSAEALMAFFTKFADAPAPAVDFERHEVVVASDPHHSCLGWPEGSAKDYERHFVMSEFDEELRFTLEARRKAAARRVLCDPLPRFVVYRIGRTEKKIAGALPFTE